TSMRPSRTFTPLRASQGNAYQSTRKGDGSLAPNQTSRGQGGLRKNHRSSSVTPMTLALSFRDRRRKRRAPQGFAGVAYRESRQDQAAASQRPPRGRLITGEMPPCQKHPDGHQERLQKRQPRTFVTR